LELSIRKRIPNALSCSRIALALAIILISRHLTVVTFVITVTFILIALSTDALDGFLARRWHVTSEAGYVLDAMGDRALHLALVLIVLVRYDFHAAYAWLLIFRDISIYAVRILSPQWLQESRQFRWLSVVHANNLRVWLLLYIVRDGVKVFTLQDRLGTFAFELGQTLLISGTFVLSYYGLARSFRWLIIVDNSIAELPTSEILQQLQSPPEQSGSH
jgi:phosphatidylglycerophosphate synthase